MSNNDDDHILAEAIGYRIGVELSRRRQDRKAYLDAWEAEQERKREAWKDKMRKRREQAEIAAGYYTADTPESERPRLAREAQQRREEEQARLEEQRRQEEIARWKAQVDAMTRDFYRRKRLEFGLPADAPQADVLGAIANKTQKRKELGLPPDPTDELSLPAYPFAKDSSSWDAGEIIGIIILLVILFFAGSAITGWY